MEISAGTFVKIVKLGRFQFLVGGFLLFCIGALLALLFNAEFNLNKLIWGYLILFAAHLSVHYSNDYFDVEADQHISPTAISGGSGILVENPELREFSKWFAIILIGLSLVLALAFTVFYSYSWWFLVFVAFGSFLGWFYSAPPIELSYHRLGEIATVLTGILLPAMGYFTLMGTLDLTFFVFSIPFAFFQLFFINSVQIPDMEGDKLGGKNTLIVLKGRKFGFKLIFLSSLLLTASFIIIPLTHLFPPLIDFRVLVLISLITLSLGILELVKKPVEREVATRFSTLNIASLFAVAILINIYFIYILS